MPFDCQLVDDGGRTIRQLSASPGEDVVHLRVGEQMASVDGDPHHIAHGLGGEVVADVAAADRAGDSVDEGAGPENVITITFSRAGVVTGPTTRPPIL